MPDDNKRMVGSSESIGEREVRTLFDVHTFSGQTLYNSFVLSSQEKDLPIYFCSFDDDRSGSGNI